MYIIIEQLDEDDEDEDFILEIDEIEVNDIYVIGVHIDDLTTVNYDEIDETEVYCENDEIDEEFQEIDDDELLEIDEIECADEIDEIDTQID